MTSCQTHPDLRDVLAPCNVAWRYARVGRRQRVVVADGRRDAIEVRDAYRWL